MQMSESILLVLPSPEQTEVLLTHPYMATDLETLRIGRQPRPPPPWFGARTRKTARLLLTKVAWKVAVYSWKIVVLALKGEFMYVCFCLYVFDPGFVCPMLLVA